MGSEQPERPRGKSRITIRIDGEVLDWFRARVEDNGGNYQTLINDALRDHVTRREGTLAETLRRVVRQELARRRRRRRARKKTPRRTRRRKKKAQRRVSRKRHK